MPPWQQVDLFHGPGVALGSVSHHRLPFSIAVGARTAAFDFVRLAIVRVKKVTYDRRCTFYTGSSALREGENRARPPSNAEGCAAGPARVLSALHSVHHSIAVVGRVSLLKGTRVLRVRGREPKALSPFRLEQDDDDGPHSEPPFG